LSPYGRSEVLSSFTAPVKRLTHAAEELPALRRTVRSQSSRRAVRGIEQCLAQHFVLLTAFVSSFKTRNDGVGG
jgi:hypothetical protein